MAAGQRDDEEVAERGADGVELEEGKVGDAERDAREHGEREQQAAKIAGTIAGFVDVFVGPSKEDVKPRKRLRVLRKGK